MKKFNDIVQIIGWIETRKRKSPKVSLDKMYKLLEIYGNPHLTNKYIHVAGTNGKGSTVSYIKHVLIEANLKVGYYISPYVIKFNERIGTNNEYITDEDVLEIGNYIISKYDYLSAINLDEPTFFEFMTLLSFIYFSKKELDVVIMEVGIGGLLDCTNVIIPIASVITNVSYDHMNVLGDTIEEIAMNKLGIVKRKVPLFTIKNGQINHLIEETIQRFDTKVIYFEKENIEDCVIETDKSCFTYKTYKNLVINLPGMHQVENACLSIEVIDYLKENYFKITDTQLYNGLCKTFWPGRLEIISREPLIILDGAHNIDGVKRLCEFLRDIKKDNHIKLFFAVSSNKEKNTMIKLLEAVVEEIIFTEFSYKRSDDALNLFNISNHRNKRIMINHDEISKEIAKTSNEIIVFCGSLYFVSEIRKEYNKKT